MSRKFCVLAMACLTLGVPALAQDEEPQRPWTDAAEFGLVMTSGNSEGTNFAFSNKFKYTWSNAELICDAAALRSESRTRVVSNGPPLGTPVITDTTAVTAATYGLLGKYRRNVTERFYWYSGAAWYQNFFAGIDDRYIVGGGVGYTLVKTDRNLLKGELGVDLTREDPLGNPPPDVLETNDFIGIRGFLGYEFAFSEKSKLTEDLNVIANMDDSNAWRANSVTALTASFTKSLALKASFTVMYSNQPPVQVIAGPTPADPVAIYEFENTDTILTVALVVNF